MKRQQAKKLLPIIQAFAEGKTIEFRTNSISKWIETTTPNFDLLHEYRIKPEPKYRPFRTKEECWNEMLKHQPFGWVKNKNVENEYYLTDGVFYSVNLECPVVSMSGEALSYKEMIYDIVEYEWLQYVLGVVALFNRKEDAQAVINNPNFREILDTVYKDLR